MLVPLLEPTKADVPGLESMLMDMARSFSPGPGGVCLISPEMVVSIPLELFMWSAYMENATLTFAASTGDDQVAWTCPGDRRVEIDYLYVVRNSGDNTFDGFVVTMPEGYVGSVDNQTLIRITASTTVWWPDSGGIQTITYVQTQARPLLVEPGSTISVSPGTAGVGETVASFMLMGRATKVFRARAPSL